MSQPPSFDPPQGNRGVLSPGDLLTIAGGAATFVGSLLPFYKVSEGGDSVSWSGWSDVFSLMPTLQIASVIALAIAVMVLLERMSDVTVPARMLGQPRARVELLASALACVTIIGFMLRSLEGLDKGAGAWLASAGSIALVVGTFMRLKERPVYEAPFGAPGTVGGQAGNPAAYAILGGGIAVLVGSFLDVFSLPGAADEAINAWGSFEDDGSSFGFIPIITIPIVLALVAAVPVALALLGTKPEPAAVGGHPWPFVQLAVTAWAALIMIGLLIGNSFAGDAEFDLGQEIGLWLMLGGAVVAAAGAVMRTQAGRAPGAMPPPQYPPYNPG